MANRAATTEDIVIVKKYANRRLYNTRSSSYITLDDLALMTREGLDFQVLDAKSSNDITHSILTQIIMEEETNGEHMLPVGFLRELISMYGDTMQTMVPAYLNASMKNFRENQRELRDVFGSSFAPQVIAKLAEENIARLQQASAQEIDASRQQAGEVLMLSGEPLADQSAPSSFMAEDFEAQAPDIDELGILRQQMAEMQKKLDKLG